ncbi:hypothetical protein N8482_00105 [Chitinophagales bacterium]|nr:hypothetical protein [Chitinophagales bacterium]
MIQQVHPTHKIILVVTVLLLLLSSCGNDDGNNRNQTTEEALAALPSEVMHPNTNPYSDEKKELGRLLFWDPVLSGTKDVACVTCHHPDFGYADGLEFSIGVGATGLGPDRLGGLRATRNAPTIINSAFNGIDENGSYDPEVAPMFWDNRAHGLEEQALLPMLSKEEMRGELISEEAIMDTILKRLNAIPEYRTLFEEAFGTTTIIESTLAEAIATFERSLIANNSPFDEYMRGNENALNNEQIRGMNAFIRVGCADCHKGSMLSDYELHTIGVQENGFLTDSGATENFDFRTPTLRNLRFTAPYMHNGLHRTLRDVLNFYEEIADEDDDELNENLHFNQLDDEMQDLRLDDDQIDAIIAFLHSLNDDDFDRKVPNDIPSGLAVGGSIK